MQLYGQPLTREQLADLQSWLDKRASKWRADSPASVHCRLDGRVSPDARTYAQINALQRLADQYNRGG